MSVAPPSVSLLLRGPVGAADAERAAATVVSLAASDLPDWELLVPAGIPTFPDEPRVRPVAGDVIALLTAAAGQFSAFLDPGDTVEPDALADVVRALTGAPDVDCVYTDEDVPGPDGGRVALRKPDWSPERLRHGDYLGRLCLLRTAAARAALDAGPAAGPAFEYDLALRVTERGGGVVHLSRVLLHRAAPPTVSDVSDAAARVAAQAHLERTGSTARVVPGPVPGSHRVERDLDPSVRVSVVIPTRWQTATIRGREQCLPVEAIRTLLAGTEHRNVEIVVVYDEPVPSGALTELTAIAGDRLVAVRYDKPFNFSEKCNLGVLHSTGDVIVLFNDDVQPVSPRWLESLVAPLGEPGVGITGAKLLYEDGTIQHGGHLHVADPKVPKPYLAFRMAPGDAVGSFNSLVVNRETSGVTGACLAITREVYDQVGGLCEDLPNNYNDVDLAMKVQFAGLRVLWLAEPTLHHFESQSRERGVADFERERLRRRWDKWLGDPYLPWLRPGAQGAQL